MLFVLILLLWLFTDNTLSYNDKRGGMEKRTTCMLAAYLYSSALLIDSNGRVFFVSL